MSKLYEINTFLEKRGYDLREMKGQNFNNTNTVSRALTKQEALEVLAFYCKLNISVLGGDVFYLNQLGEIGWTYDN